MDFETFLDINIWLEENSSRGPARFLPREVTRPIYIFLCPLQINHKTFQVGWIRKRMKLQH